jgi:hypothetical protein
MAEYGNYRDFYALFEDVSPYLICDDEANACTVAKCICEGLRKGRFIVS